MVWVLKYATNVKMNFLQRQNTSGRILTIKTDYRGIARNVRMNTESSGGLDIKRSMVSQQTNDTILLTWKTPPD
jgi:hypothetical protein